MLKLHFAVKVTEWYQRFRSASLAVMCVCHSVYVSLCVSLCICLCVCLSVYVSLCVSLCVCVSLCICLCVCVTLHMSLCVCLYMCVCATAYVSVCVFLYVYVCLCVALQMSLSVCGSLSLYMSVCVHTHAKTSSHMSQPGLSLCVCRASTLTHQAVSPALDPRSGFIPVNHLSQILCYTSERTSVSYSCCC